MMRTQLGAGRRAFTIVEMLVVVGVITVLVGLLFPAISSVQKNSRATVSKSNLQQWGRGMVQYTTANKERLPWEGLKDAAQMQANLAQPAYWANAIPEFADQRPYTEIVEEAFLAQRRAPIPPERNIFLDPSAKAQEGAPWEFGPSGAAGIRRTFFFCYVPNSQLNNTFQADGGIADFSPNRTLSMSMIPSAAETVFMLEMRATPEELPADDVHFGRDLRRHRSDWKRFAARHFDGGHICFADGHIALVKNADATTSIQDSRDPSQPDGDWNKPGLIWDPLGPALDDN